MTDPEIPVYGTSDMYVRTRTGWRQVGLPDNPIMVRTRTGWRPFPAIGDEVKVLTRIGWHTAVGGA